MTASASSGGAGSFVTTATVTWTSPAPVLTTSAVTGTFYAADGSGVFNTALNAAPAFTQTFGSLLFNTNAIALSPVNDTTRPFTNVAVTRAGAYAGTVVAQDVNGYQAGAGPLFNFNAVFTGTLNVPSAGQRSFTITSSDGFVLGIGNGATRVSGPLSNAPVATTFKGYEVMGATNIRQAPAVQTIVVNFPAAGAYPYEFDYSKGGDSRLTLTMLADGAAIPAATFLSLTPQRVPSATGGTISQLTVSATDAGGIAQPNLPVTVLVTGQNEQQRAITTDGTGTGTIAYVGSPSRLGTDTIQAIARVNGVDVYSNIVTQQWNNGANAAPTVSAGAPTQSVELPRSAQLNGTIADDGLPLAPGNTTATWTTVSGPGSVTFGNAAQAVTDAAFSVPGTYVLRLTGSDGVLTAFSDTTVTVTAPVSWSSGWIANPLDQAVITDRTPINLVAGITLTSGILRYRAANAPLSESVTLVANTTGTGTLATFDPTTLRNGAYWIELTGTNTSGVNQANTVLVTVQGDVKLGRVLATTTDLKVPAPGMAIKIERTYDSLNRGRKGDFGFGWDLGVKVQMEVSPTNAVTLTMGGRRRTFHFTPPPNAIFQQWYTPQWTAERGLYGKLETTGDNCGGTAATPGVLQRVANVYQCAINNAGQSYVSTGYKYTDPQGTIYTIGATGLLSSVVDLNGNTLTVTETGISSNSGLSVPFVRDAQGRITSITDPLGKIYRYYYNAAGELITFEQPLTPVANTQYTYAAGHYLKSEIDPRNNTATTNYYPDGRIQSITTGVGDTTSFAYDQTFRRTTVTNPDTGIEETDLNVDGDLVRKKDGLGRVSTFAYDANRNLASETNAALETKNYTYNANGFRTSTNNPAVPNYTTTVTYNAVGGPLTVTDGTGFTQTMTYDANLNLQKIVDPLVAPGGAVAEFTYNAQGLPATMKDARGNTHTFGYNANGDRTTTVEPLGPGVTRTMTAVFNSRGERTSEVNARGFTTSYEYDALSRMTKLIEPLGKITQYEYDANGNKTAEIDALLRRTEFIYDGNNRLIKTRYPAPGNSFTETETTYDFRGKPLTTKDELGRITKYEYDLAGQLKKVTKALGTADASVTETTYDNAGRKVTEKDARGNVTTYGYAPAGRMTSMTNANNKTWLYEYDNRDRRTKMTDPRARITRYEYDGRGRQTKITYPDTTFVLQTYDPMGLMLSRADQENKTSFWSYDVASRIRTMTDALGNVTEYGLDKANNKETQKDARNSQTTYEWDALDRRTKRCLPLGMCETTTYDVVGNMLTRTDFNGRTTSFSYDVRNRQLNVLASTVTFPGEPGITRTYTATGKVATMVDASGTTSWTYDNQDRILTKTTPQGTLSYAHYPNSLVASVTSSNANGTSVSYAYDTSNRLSVVIDNRLGNSTTNTSDDDNNLSAIAYPNGLVHSYTVDQKDHVVGLQVQRNAAILASYGYTRGATGIINSFTESNGRAVNYTYDNAWRLTNETITGDFVAANNGNLSYLLDAVANRTSLTSSLPALSNQSLSFDANDRITADTSDGNGNTLTSNGKTYTYDFLDRLTTATGGVILIYDGDGNRVARTVGGVTTRYLVDDQTPLRYSQVAEEVVAGSLTRRYAYGLQRISQTQGGTTSYYVYDGGGTVRALADTTGVVTDTFTCDAFGNLIARTGTTPSEMLYRGEQFDAVLGFYYLRARWYNPSTGRFVVRDPMEPEPVNVSTPHTYNYASDPVHWVDPKGTSITMERLVKFAYITMAVATFTATVQVFNGTQTSNTGYDVACALNKAGSALSNAIKMMGLVGTVAGSLCTLPVSYSTRISIDGVPGSEVESYDRHGKLKQVRRYGDDGFATVDTDYDHPDHYVGGSPHVHDWGRKPGGGPPTQEDRLPGRPPRPGDPGFPIPQ